MEGKGVGQARFIQDSKCLDGVYLPLVRNCFFHKPDR